MKLKTKRVNWARLAFQWGVILFILILAFLPKLTKIASPDFEAYCPFGGLQALGSYLLNQALSCTMTSAQIVMGLILLVGVILFSKLFCSFICPIGTVSEWLGKLGDKFKIRFTIKGIFDKILRALKYALLFITLYYTLKSNELFCKKFDPYYALTSGFDNDVVFLWAIIAIAVVILGSVFIRLFWCKYLCPLGAISNIFKFSFFFVALMGVYLILLRSGIEISYVYPLAVACTGGFIIELLGQKSRIFPVAKITRDTSSCTNCNLCTKKCPQGIDVASVEKVKHVDCNLCGDCLLACPEKKTLTINKQPKLKWLPVIAAVALVTFGVILGSVWEIPTIDEKWGDPEEIESAEIFTQSGMKNIKCYGSSKAFANKMRSVDGIYGVATFVKNHRVKLYYDAEKLTNEKIQKLLFTPQKKVVRPLQKGIETVYGITIQLENFFDSYDFNYLSVLLKDKTSAVAVLSEYACPVIVKILFPAEVEDIEELIEKIETEELTIETRNGPVTIELKYEVVGNPEFFTLSRKEYTSFMFTPFGRKFNYRERYSDDVMKNYTFPLGQNAKLRSRLSYITSHLSNDNGIVQLKTELDSTFNEVVSIGFIDSMTNIGNINNLLLSDSLTVTYSNGRTGKVANMFDFSGEVKKQDNE